MQGFAGQLDQCLWAVLGKSNFLHSIPSTFKCYTLESDHNENGDQVVLHNYLHAKRGEFLTFQSTIW